jgi:ABC-type bacteriocin/lantibiotic exporter with double-glycine peptidase domain
LDSWNVRYAKSLDAYKQKYMVKNINDSVLSVLQILAPLVLLSIGIFQYMDNKMTMGEAIAIYTLAGNLFTTGMSVFQIVNSFMLATSYLERITDIVDADIEEQPLQPVDLKIKGEIKLDNISFSYTNHSANVIEDLSLHIKAGEKVALVGASGCGKSTLVKIIMGLYEPHSGHILFDGVNIEELHKVNLRRQVGVVPQDMTLFNKTIYENICLHRTVDVETVIQVAKIAQIDEEIQKMPMKYQTLVSDMGMNLSGGQRQRIVLARALLNQPELIILDEATSALDNENEQRVSTYFETMKCTRLIIAHRLSTIIDCDKIIVLERGKIKEMGTHGELMQQGGVYSNLYNIVENTVRLA